MNPEYDFIIFKVLHDMKLEKLMEDYFDHRITADEMYKDFGEFQRRASIAFSREQTAQDVDICLN